MDLKDGAHVDLWVIEGLVTELLDGGQTLASDVILQQVPELSKTVRNAGNKLKEANEYLIAPQNSGPGAYTEDPTTKTVHEKFKPPKVPKKDTNWASLDRFKGL